MQSHNEKPNSMVEAVAALLRYKVVDETGRTRYRYPQYPHDFTMRKGWKIIDTQE